MPQVLSWIPTHSPETRYNGPRAKNTTVSSSDVCPDFGVLDPTSEHVSRPRVPHLIGSMLFILPISKVPQIERSPGPSLPHIPVPLAAEQVPHTHPAWRCRTTTGTSVHLVQHQEGGGGFLVKVSLRRQSRARQRRAVGRMCAMRISVPLRVKAGRRGRRSAVAMKTVFGRD
jgi:hypothetical protein